MKSLEKIASMKEYTDPLFVGIAPRTVQERTIMSKRKMIGAGIGGAVGLGAAYAAKHLDPDNYIPNAPSFKGVAGALSTGGLLLGTMAGNYSAHLDIARRRRALSQDVYNRDDIDKSPIVSIDGQLLL